MKLWFGRDRGVPVRDQLTTQILLAIATGELPPGSRLPSTRALARRFGLHPNTVSAAYRELEAQGWMAPVRGSGVYVCELRDGGPTADQERLDLLAGEFLRAVRRSGFPASEVREHLNARLDTPVRRFAFVHADRDLQRLVTVELGDPLQLEVIACDPDSGLLEGHGAGTVF